ncbi:hypothetical protein CR513_03010, partial [Mucuna pruriens]
MQRLKDISIQRQVLMNQRMNNPVNYINIFGGSHLQLLPRVDIRQPFYTQTITCTITMLMWIVKK